MEKYKVSKIAKELNTTSKEVITKFKDMGIDVKLASDEVLESDYKRMMKSERKVAINELKEKQSTAPHIIRRQVKVITTEENKKTVENITTDIAGGIVKSHHTIIDDKNKETYNREGLGVVTPKNFNRPKFGQNRSTNIVVTRNGKPVDFVENVEEKKVGLVKEVEVKEAAVNVEEKKSEVVKSEVNNIRPNNQEGGYSRPNNGYNNRPNNSEGGYNRPNNGGFNRNGNTNATGYNNRPNNGGFNRNGNTNATGYNNRPNNGYNNRPNNQEGGYNRPNNGYNNRPSNSEGGYNRPNNGYNNRPNNQEGGYNRPNNSSGGYRNNNYSNQGRFNNDNTSYQVNKFIKASSTVPVEQKEMKDYTLSLIDKRKNKDTNTSDKKGEKINKNELREKHSRVSTSKLKGLEINTSSGGLLDLYERDTDLVKKSNRKKPQRQTKIFEQTKIIPMTEVKLPETMSVKEFAEAIKKQASEIIKKLFGLGIMATVNQEIDYDTAYLIAEEYGITAEKLVIVTDEDKLFDDTLDEEKDLTPRPPIVVVMGHVDHGKTSLLDRIRCESVVACEAGGITQHIGAYKVQINNREICFLDTPGHEAFTQMRARGAQVTDIAIIVVAADDGIKPQTIEAIDHAKAAGVSIVVAINKIDKPAANIERVKQELLEVGLVAEEWGGDTICVPISALTGQGIEQLLEMLILVADMKELKSNPNKQAKGTVIEARLDKNTGTMVSMLVQRGTLNVGDTIVVGDIIGKIRAMKDDKGRKVKEAGPSTPVEILGLPTVPQTGDIFYEVKDEKTAKHLVETRKAEARINLIKKSSKVTLNDLFSQIKEGEIKDINIIIKADVQGSVEALRDSLEKLSNDEVRVRTVHASTGGVKESDVTLAAVSNAIIIAFNVRPDAQALIQADKEKVDLRTYRIIYDAINDVETAMKGMLAPTYKEVIHGNAEVRQIFKVSSVGTIAGCYVKSGKIVRNTKIRVIRDSVVLGEYDMDSLRREKDDVKEAKEGYECGIKLVGFDDIKELDILECFEMQEEKRV